MPYCINCGSQIIPYAKFCVNCGAAQNNQPVYVQPKPEVPQYYSPTSSPLPPPPPAPTATFYQPPPQMQPPVYQPPQTQQPASASGYGSEAVIGVLLLRLPKSFGRWDTYTGVLTTQRIIFAQMTQEMLNAAIQQSRDRAKADGKGFWGQWADQLRAGYGYSQKYLGMNPNAIVAETPGNFWLNNDTIGEVKVKLKELNRDDSRQEFAVEFRSSAGTYEYHMDENSDSIDLIKRVFGDRVKMPFGYFSKTVNIKF